MGTVTEIEKEYITRDEAAEFLSLGRSTIIQYCKEQSRNFPKAKKMRGTNKVYFLFKDIKDWQKSRMEDAAVSE